MSLTRVLVILLTGISLLIVARANAGVFVSVDSSPLTIPADGLSHSQILVTVLDQTGVPIADGTEVRLTTSAGDITPVVFTSDGRAIGILTSASVPQIATINAIANGISNSVQVEFSASYTAETAAVTRTIRMSGGSLAYSVDLDTVLGSNGVTIEYKGLTIQAAGAQVCTAAGQIRAQGEVSVRKGDQTLTADAFSCDTRKDQIGLLDSKDQPRVLTFNAGNLKPADQEKKQFDAQAFVPLLTTDGKTWIVSQKLVLIPGDKILFYKASIYVGDSKVITMPYYSYSYQKRESILQQVRYDSSGGMLVDFPLYYRMTDSGTGALKLRYAADGGEFGGYSRPRKGLSMGLEQDYSIGDGNQGRMFIDSIGSPSQSIELAQHLEFGSLLSGGRADISTRYQPDSSYAKNIYNTSLNVMGSLRNYNYSVSGYFGGSSIQQFDYLNPQTIKYADQSTSTLKTVFSPKAPIASNLFGNISPSWAVGYGILNDSSGIFTSPSLYQTLGLSCYRSKSGSGGISTSFNGTTGLTLAANGDTGVSLRLSPSISRSWMGGSASISYTLNLQDGTTDSVSSSAKHQLGCSLFLYGGGRWSSCVSANYGLDFRQSSLYSTLNYRLMKNWQLRSSYNLYGYVYDLNGKLYSSQTSYLKVGIYRPLGPYEVGLAWSPNGQNYGIDRDRRIWLELGARGF